MLDPRSTPCRRRRSGRFHHSTSRNDPAPLVFAPDIGMQKMERNLQSTDTPGDEPPGALEQCVQNSLSVKTAVEDELEMTRLPVEIPSMATLHFCPRSLPGG
jgi:hypothetical protein